MRKDELGPAVVEWVVSGSPADDAGIKPGDWIWSIDSEPMRDLIDCFLLLADDVEHVFLIERDGLYLEAAVDARGKDIGIIIEQPVFGRVFTCNNSCVFCFVDQMPAGLDRVFYIKDDDYRLCFLGGNFITLTNLRREDLRRIIDERLSPLYVSLHATDTGLRRRIFGGQTADRAIPALETILDAGCIDVHLQIVLVRGMNDGARLDETLSDIRSTYTGVSTIGVVPVGITTTGRRALPLGSGFDAGSAGRLLEQVEGWARELGPGRVFAADEFYYLAGEDVPPREHYGEYHQLENGVGLARFFRHQFEVAVRQKRSPIEGVPGTAVVTTSMGAWALGPLELERRYGARLVECENTLFGERVNVCGLMAGKDVIRSLAGTAGVGRALVPEVALRDESKFIDGITIEDVAAATGLEVLSVPDEGRSLLANLTRRC